MRPHRVAQNTHPAIFTRLIEAREGDLSEAAARYLLSFRFDHRDTARVTELNEKASLGILTAEEEVEPDSYIHVGNLLAIMQSNARRALKATGSTHE
jgi:hypothetical protein